MELSAQHPADTPTDLQKQNKAGRFGMWLFLAALTMLFGACVVGYLIIRFRLANKIALGEIQLPSVLWISTIAILLSSLTIERACGLLQRDKKQGFKQQLIWTDMLAGLFVLTQVPGMLMLLRTHQQLVDDGVAMYGMVFMVILLHAIHILGGLIPLGMITKRALTTGYTAETFLPVRLLAMYWHFLGIIWLILFAMLFLMG
ncbi:MAG: heme-copper oxidase subunit III [Phycisphaeraceae bacterium JB051]